MIIESEAPSVEKLEAVISANDELRSLGFGQYLINRSIQSIDEESNNQLSSALSYELGFGADLSQPQFDASKDKVDQALEVQQKLGSGLLLVTFFPSPPNMTDLEVSGQGDLQEVERRTFSLSLFDRTAFQDRGELEKVGSRIVIGCEDVILTSGEVLFSSTNLAIDSDKAHRAISIGRSLDIRV